MAVNRKRTKVLPKDFYWQDNQWALVFDEEGVMWMVNKDTYVLHRVRANVAKIIQRILKGEKL